MSIALTGLGSFDSSGLVSQLVAIAQQPITDLQTRQSTLNSAVSTMNTYVSRLSTLRANAATMADPTGYSSFSATSSDTSVVTSTGIGAQPGSYAVNVTQLASIEKLRSNTQASSSAALGMSGTLALQIGSGTAVNLSIASTDTLGDIATKISQSGARVSASVLYDGTNYRLAVQGLDTGAANAINVTQTGFDLGLQKPANVYQAASDAKLTVDGLDITRPTNSISGVIPGVTMALTKPGVSSTVNVATDTTALKTKLNGFVSAFNDIANATHTATGYGSTKATNTFLQGNSTLRRAFDTITGLVANAVPGATGRYTTLGSVGIKLANDGTLTFDSTAFDTAAAADPGGVSKLFVTDTSSGATGIMKSMTTSIDTLMKDNSSPMKSAIAALTKRSSNITDEMANKQTRVDAYQTQLKRQYSNLDVIMSKYSAMATAITNMTPTTSG